MKDNISTNSNVSRPRAPLSRRLDERGVLTLTIERPEKRNALSLETLLALTREFDALQSDASDDSLPRLVVLRGADPYFCAGLDLNEARSGAPLSLDELEPFHIPTLEREARRLGAVERGRVMPRVVQETLKRVKTARPLVVGRARGSACGGGAGLLSACDLVLVDASFRAAFTETKLGLYPTLLFPFLKRKFPLALLQNAVLTARPFDALYAERLGLAQRVASEDELDAALDETIDVFLSNDQEALEEAKRLFTKETLPGDAELDEGWERHWQAWNSASCQARLDTFFARKRQINAPAQRS